MSEDDEDERDTGKSRKSVSQRRREGESLGEALEASLQAGLRSLSDGLQNIVEGDSGGTGSSARHPRPRPSARRRRSKKTRSSDTGSSEGGERVKKPKPEECLIETRLADDEFIVVADMLGASVDDISVGISSSTNELAISKKGTVVGRVDVPWNSSRVEDSWYQNGVLEVYLRPDDSDSPA